MTYRLGFGPMSPVVIDALVGYARPGRPLMIIASRNQVDSDGGYVMTTQDLVDRTTYSSYIRLCRDHCGPYFLDSEKSLSLEQAVEATKRTIATDLENGFDLIHIDTSRCPNPYSAAESLIKFALDLNPKVKFEFGTEENVGVAAGEEKYREDVKFASQFPNMEYVVAQTGSLVMETQQVGGFAFDVVKGLADYAHQAGVKLKEHNADYLTADQIKLRAQAGVDALNIAPQLGVVQTQTILRLADEQDVDSSEFKRAVLDSGKWAKWMIGTSERDKIECAGHYCYKTPEFYDLVGKLQGWAPAVHREINKVLDLYYNNLT